MTADATPIPLDAQALRAWPLPEPDTDGDKEERGRVLVVAGSRQVPGAALLAGVAALRAGAGKLIVATSACMAQGLGLAIPEARIIGMPENEQGAWNPEGVGLLEGCAARLDAVLIGPGLDDSDSTLDWVEALLPKLGDAKVILDAAAMKVIGRLQRFERAPLLTPHAGEMASLCGADKRAVESDRLRAVVDAAARWNAIVALKGSRTLIAMPDGRVWSHESRNAGLATSGSGDVLAGIVAGLAARGASLQQACAWGVALHARAGERLARRMGPLGFMARELSGEVPQLMNELSG